MLFRQKLTYFDAIDFALVPEPFRIFWGDYVLDARTGRASDLKQFGDQFRPWESTTASGSGLNIEIMGTNEAEVIVGDSGNAVMIASGGNDILHGNGGVDFLMGGWGQDKIYSYNNFFARVKAGDGNDLVFGGDGIEWAHGNDGADILRLGKGNDKGYGGADNDRLFGGAGADWLQGGGGRDYVKGGFGSDTLKGGTGNDRLVDRKGRDWLDGQEGDDVLVARSDHGRPEQKISEIDRTLPELTAWSDRLTGGEGADVFKFTYQMNATDQVSARNADAEGRVNWMDVMSENDAHHDHWVDWGGFDKIEDYSREEGDRIRLAGHTVDVDELVFVDTDNDGIDDSTMIYVYSNQAKMMAEMNGVTEAEARNGMQMAHDLDFLGQILVENALIDRSEILINDDSMASAFNFI